MELPRLRRLVALAIATGALWLLSGLGALPAVRSAAAQPASLTVAAPVATATGADFLVTWPGGGSYAWSAAYSDGTGGQQATSSSPLTLRMPYHVSNAAAPGWICVSTSCSGFTVPAKPTAPPASSVRTLIYVEPSTNVDGTPLNDLRGYRLYYSIDGGPEQMVEFPASSPQGGASRSAPFTVAAAQGTLTGFAAVVDLGGVESARTGPIVPLVFGTVGVPGTPSTKPSITIRYQ
jgi:hypothetical protein